MCGCTGKSRRDEGDKKHKEGFEMDEERRREGRRMRRMKRKEKERKQEDTKEEVID